MDARSSLSARNARREAQDLIGARGRAWVLEPSPPAVSDAPWFADDPVAAGDLSWPDWLGRTAGHEEWAAERWLGAYRRLPRPPAALDETRLALHRVAVYAVSPARRRANGRIGLRWTLGGFGTPFFGADEQVRVQGALLVRQRGGEAVAEPITTLARAAALALDGPPDIAWARGSDVPAAGDPDAPLAVDPAAAALLGDWYGFAWSVLEEVRADPGSAPAGRVELWPEHFDAAFEGLPEASGRATFGASPGDAAVSEPYLYVLAGGELTVARLGDLVDADDQRGVALAFYRGRRDQLAGA